MPLNKEIEIELFFVLLDNLAPITWPSEEDPAELCQQLRGSFKHNVGTEGFDKADIRELIW